MEIMWAPWRMEIIKQGYRGSCLFCDKAAEKDDRTNLILERGKLSFVMLNLYPYNNGHIMVAPFRHTSLFEELTKEELAEINGLSALWIRVIRRAMSPDGFNMGVNMGKPAGAGVVDHIHFHTVPRWTGDTNFMPVTADTKVISQSLEAAWELLTKARNEF